MPIDCAVCEHVQVEQILSLMSELERFGAEHAQVADSVYTNALLNTAVERLLRERGFDKTAHALYRLAGLIAARVLPGGTGVPLNRNDS